MADEHNHKRRRVESGEESNRRLRFAVVCASNQNRSMEAHKLMAQAGFDVKSYGTGNFVKIPGPSIDKPNKWEFGAESYDEMHKQLVAQDKALYQQNGMLSMLARNRTIKTRPEKFQATKDEFDVVITCETRVFDQVVQSLEEKEQESCEPVHICNVEIKDTHEEATVGALAISKLCGMLEKVEDLEDGMEEVLSTFEEKHTHSTLHTVAYY